MKLDLFKSSEPKEIYPRAVKELVVEILSALVIIFENSWNIGEVMKERRRANKVPVL